MEIKNNILSVEKEIQEACISSKRERSSVSLLAVSKFNPCESIIEAYKAGLKYFGESRVQEATEKIEKLGDSICGSSFAFIGHLQKNKVKKAVEYFDEIQSVDSISLAEEIEKKACACNKKIKMLFELHTGEESKSGFENEKALLEAIEIASSFKFAKVCGLMTMAPNTDDEIIIRKSFSTCRKLLEKIQKEFGNNNFNSLSMGMSHDFKIAIDEGSTIVRIGTSIFGERNYNA